MSTLSPLASAFVTFHKAEGRAESALRAALKADAGNIDLRPLATGIVLVGGAKWASANANTNGAMFFSRILDAAKSAADEMGLERDARKNFMNPLRAKVQRAIVALSGIDPKLVKENAKPADKPARAGATNDPRPDASEADTNESAATVRRKIEEADILLTLATLERLAVVKTAGDKRDLEKSIAFLKALAA